MISFPKKQGNHFHEKHQSFTLTFNLRQSVNIGKEPWKQLSLHFVIQNLCMSNHSLTDTHTDSKLLCFQRTSHLEIQPVKVPLLQGELFFYTSTLSVLTGNLNCFNWFCPTGLLSPLFLTDHFPRRSPYECFFLSKLVVFRKGSFMMILMKFLFHSTIHWVLMEHNTGKTGLLRFPIRTAQSRGFYFETYPNANNCEMSLEGKVERRMLRHTWKRNGTEWSGVPPFVRQTEKVSGPT